MQKNLPIFPPLNREQVIRAVERRSPERIPIVLGKLWGQGFPEAIGSRLAEFDIYPEDAAFLWMEPFDYKAMQLSWPLPGESGAMDSRAIIDDWSKLDEFIAKLPKPENDPRFPELERQCRQYRAKDRYVLFAWWRLFFERPWQLRGMENLMVDYYLHPQQVHRLHQALCDYYSRFIRQAARLFKPDAFFTSDDLGNQRQPMMRPETFVEFIKPYYRQLGKVIRECDLHWWLHSCGDNFALLPHLIEAGVEVFHPVQKNTMDAAATAREFSGQLTFLVGFDVQQTLPYSDPQAVREEVRRLIDTFDRPDGGMCMAAGNGILPGTPLENIHAFLQETLEYGSHHRRRFI